MSENYGLPKIILLLQNVFWVIIQFTSFYYRMENTTSQQLIQLYIVLALFHTFIIRWIKYIPIPFSYFELYAFAFLPLETVDIKCFLNLTLLILISIFVIYLGIWGWKGVDYSTLFSKRCSTKLWRLCFV